MSKKNGMEEVQQLIDLGKEKGYLTYDEVNDILPEGLVSSDQLDDVMSSSALLVSLWFSPPWA